MLRPSPRLALWVALLLMWAAPALAGKGTRGSGHGRHRSAAPVLKNRMPARTRARRAVPTSRRTPARARRLQKRLQRRQGEKSRVRLERLRRQRTPAARERRLRRQPGHQQRLRTPAVQRRQVAAATRTTEARRSGSLRRVVRRVRRGLSAAKRFVNARWLPVSARLTVATDHVVAHLPRALRPIASGLRDLSPVHLAAFVANRVKRDPVFLTSYFVATNIVSQATTPLLMAFGVAAGPAVLARYWTAPIDFVVLVLRSRYRRGKDNPSITTRQVARDVVRDYREMAESRRQRGRDYLATGERRQP